MHDTVQDALTTRYLTVWGHTIIIDIQIHNWESCRQRYHWFHKQDIFIPQGFSQKEKVPYPCEYYTNISPCVPAYAENFPKNYRCWNNNEESILTTIFESDHDSEINSSGKYKQ